jgi:hypothetical protein
MNPRNSAGGTRHSAIWICLAAVLGCASTDMSEFQQAAVRNEVQAALRDAYDLSKPDVEQRMLSLYPATGRVVSASAGRITTSRDTLENGIRYFWQAVGVNMKGARWIWDTMYVDVITPTNAVVTGRYHIPHKTPRGEDHVIAGAMTAVFTKRDGKWAIIQEHLSDVPRQAGEPSMDAAPPPPSTTKKPQ